MLLSFKQKFDDGRPTYFVEKIWASLKELYPEYWERVVNTYYGKAKDKYLHNSVDINLVLTVKPKFHTIREDSSDRWRIANDIHFAINVRSPWYFQFAPKLLCSRVQKFEVKYFDVNFQNVRRQPIVYIDDKVFFDGTNFGDYRNEEQMLQFAVNDGFGSIEDFFAWFSSDFEGKIIHWTNLKY